MFFCDLCAKDGTLRPPQYLPYISVKWRSIVKYLQWMRTDWLADFFIEFNLCSQSLSKLLLIFLFGWNVWFPLRPVTNKPSRQWLWFLFAFRTLLTNISFIHSNFMRLEGDIFIEEKSLNMLMKSPHVGFSLSRSLSIVRKRFVASHVLSIVCVILCHLVHSRKLAKNWTPGNKYWNSQYVEIA